MPLPPLDSKGKKIKRKKRNEIRSSVFNVIVQVNTNSKKIKKKAFSWVKCWENNGGGGRKY